MDKIDLKIKSILSQSLIEPVDFEEKIKHSLDNEKQTKRKLFIFNPIPLAVASMLLFSGIVLAVNITTNAPQKVWEEPKEKVVEEKLLSPIITDEEKQELLPESEIEQKAKEILSTCGYSEAIIEAIELHRNYDDDLKNLYFVYTNIKDKTKGIYLTINPKTGELLGLQNSDYSLIQDQLSEISEDKAISSAKDVIISLGYSLDNSEIESIEQLGENNHLVWWHINISNDNIDDYTNYNISIGILNNQTIVRNLGIVKTVKPDDNQYIITEDEAIQIAISKEQEFSNQAIKSATAKKAKGKMNMVIYCLENDIRDVSSLEITPRIRNIWKVRIEHENNLLEENEELDDFEFFKRYGHKIYFVDATTGEIIGGGSIAIDY